MRCLAALLLLAVAGPCEIIDRIAVTIGQAVITESELLRQIRVTALLNGEQPDFGRISKLDTADRLVEQALIRREMEISKISVDADEPAKQLYAAFRQRFPSEEAYLAALREYNLTEEDVREALHWQATLLQFIELRFEPGIQIGEEEIRDYYEREVKPAADAKDEPISYEQARADIETILIAQRVDNALDRWIGQARTQTDIKYKEEVLR